ncbi:Rib/alpha-like domain-containing protein, partial [Streptococcus sp. 5346]|uniref:Rib/alpha-like domain-containing protein n=1 Tax=Streptococcus sp. 5346 TaxID=2582636 RepID=UPI001565E825
MERLASNSYQDSGSQSLWGDAGGLFQMSGGPTRDDQRQQMLKQLEGNEDLNRIIKNSDGSYPRASYSHLLTISSKQNYAYKFHIKVRLRDNVTDTQAQTAGTIAVTAKAGLATNALQAYVYAATGTRLETRPDKQLYPIKGKEVTKTVGDSLGDVSNPVASDFVVRNDDTKNFPGGMRWNWTNGQPSTSTAGIFKYNVTATYSDNSSNSATATLKVIPKTPVIEQSSVNEKAGEKGQNVVVTVQDGVPNGSTVTLYSGNTVIGTGTTSGRTATVNVSGALPSTAITAKTTVTSNNGTVDSALSEPVTPTEVPDSVAPTVSINGKALTTNADDNRFIIYRGANFNPTFRVQDDKNNVTLSITGLPNGVGNVSTSGSKDLSYTIPENTVATDAPFGESTATVVANDGRNSATYKFKYRVVDVQAKDTPKTVAINSTLGNAQNYLKVVDNNTGTEASKYLPDGVTYKWFDSTTFGYAPNSTVLSEAGTVSKYYATATFPQSNTVKKTIDNVEHTIYYPANTPRAVVFNVQDNVAPTVKLTNVTWNNTVEELKTDANTSPMVTIFRGAKLNLPLSFYDNETTGRVNLKYISGLPSGVTFGGTNNQLTETGKTEQSQGRHTITGVVASNATLGDTVVTLKVSDAQNGDVNSGNQAELKFRLRVLDLDFEEARSTQPNQPSITVNATAGQNLEDANNYLTVNDGTNRRDNFPSGMTFRMVDSTTNTVISKLPDAPGRYVVKARAYFPVGYAGTNEVSEVVTGNTDSQLNGRRYMEKTINFVVKPTAPTITPVNGDVTITPANETNVNTLNFTYIHPNGSTQNITATKTGSTWSLTNAPADGVTINGNTGVVTIKDRAVKDNQTVTAKSVTAGSTQADRVESDITNGTSPAGDTERPKFVFQPDANPSTGEKVVEGGKQIVYVTPTETTDITVGSVTDNSGKLLEVRISDQSQRDYTLGLGSGVTNNEVVRADNTEIDAPKPVTITGTVAKLNGTTAWRNNDVITRYVQAKDAATNEIDTQGNSNQVTFKILTQAAKYTPTVGTQLLNKDVTANGAKVTADEFTAIKNSITFTAERGTVKISNAANNRTTGLDITMKDEGAIKHDNAGYYVEATVSYPDGTSEVVRVNVDKSDKEAPKVKLHGVELKENSTENPKFIVFRGAKFDPTFEVTDNANPITSLNATGLPTGTFTKTGSFASRTEIQVTENNIVPTGDALTLGEHEASVTVKDASNNEKTYNFKYIVADVEVKNTPETVALGTKLVDAANSRNGKDAHNYVKAVVASNVDGDDKYYPRDMSFNWSKDGANVSTTTTFDTPGIVKYKAVADFYGLGGIYTKTVDGVGNNIKIYAPDKIEREVTFKVQPTAPTVSQWQNGNLKVTPTTDHDKVTIPLKDGSVTLVKKATGWEVETPKEGVIVRGDSVEIPKDLLGTTITAKGTKGTGDSAVDSENAPSYTLLSHTVNKADIIKKPTDTIATTDLSGATGVTGVTDNNVNKAYANAGITSVEFTNGTPTLTPDSERNVPVTITYNDGSKENVDVTLKVAPAAPNVTVNAQNNKTGDVTLTIKRHDNSNYPDDSVVTVPGIDGTFKVKDGTITIKNDQLKDTVQTGKVTVTEGTKLPAETSDDKQIPKKLVPSGTPTFTVGNQDPTDGHVDVTVSGVPDGTKVTLPGVNGEKVVTGGKVTLTNNDLPETPQTGKGSAKEEGKLPKEGTSDITIPKKLVPSGTPTFTVGNQDPTDGHVDVTVSGVPDGTKVTLPGVNGEKVVTGGKVTLTNNDLPETHQTGK